MQHSSGLYLADKIAEQTTDGECLLHVSQSSQEHCLGKDQEMRRNQTEQNNPWSMVMETA